MRQLFVLDPLRQINPDKDSSAALMQAAQRAGDDVWACTPSDLIARGDEPLAVALPVTPDPWIGVGAPERQSLSGFDVIWMRKDPPVDEGYLYATHLLEVAERAGVRVLNRPSALRAWNEKLGALRFSRWMAPTLVAGRISELTQFAAEQGEVVLKPLGGRAGLGVIRVSADAPGLKALLDLVTDQERLPVMALRFLPAVMCRPAHRCAGSHPEHSATAPVRLQRTHLRPPVARETGSCRPAGAAGGSAEESDRRAASDRSTGAPPAPVCADRHR